MGDANLKDPYNDNHEGGKIADLEKKEVPFELPHHLDGD